MTRIAITMDSNTNEPQAGRLSRILAEVAMTTPGLALDFRDPSTLLLAIPKLLERASQQADAILVEEGQGRPEGKV